MLLIGVAVLGRWTAGDRARLLRWFRPALVATVIGAVALLVIDGAVVIGAAYIGSAVFLEFTLPGVLVIAAILIAVAVYAIARSMLRATRSPTSKIGGLALTPEQDPDTYRFVEGLSDMLGTAPPDAIVVGLEPTFFVTEVDVRLPDATLSGRTMYLSLPLCQILRPDELTAILGHELGHFIGLDTQWSRKFYPVYAGTSKSIRALRMHARGLSAIAAYPADAVLTYFLESFAENERAISREREIAADAVGASLVDARESAIGLCKVDTFASAWWATVTEASHLMVTGTPVANLSERFVDVVRRQISETPSITIDEARMTHPTDTHPPTTMRLAALGIQLADVEGAVRDVTPQPSASEIIGRSVELEEALTKAFNDAIRPVAAAIVDQSHREAAFSTFVDDFESAYAERRKGKSDP